MITITLPWPPSVNRYWRAVGGRNILSKEGRDYRLRAMIAIRQQSVGRITGRIACAIKAFPPDNRRRDVDNILKGLLDALTAGEVYEDDSHIDQLSIERMPKDKANPRMEITLTNKEQPNG